MLARALAALLAMRKEGVPFPEFLWSFVDGAPRTNRWSALRPAPARTPASDAMSKGLVRRGFRFVGPTICYAFMQAVGMVNDHQTDCFRHEAIRKLPPRSGRQ